MLKGKQINLRLLESNDLDWFTEWNNDPNYKGPYEPHEHLSRIEVEEWYNSEKNAEWWVITNKKGTPMGQMVTGPKSDYYWLGYILHPDYRGKGYTTEAVILMVKHLFTSSKIIRIQAECNPKNKASVKVLEKAGFTYKRLKRKAALINGEYQDGAIYSIINDKKASFVK